MHKTNKISLSNSPNCFPITLLNMPLLGILFAASVLFNSTFAQPQQKQAYGIGVSFQLDPTFENYPIVMEVIAATSAYNIGVEKGWHILAVEGIDLKGKNQFDILNMIRGKEGSFVKIKFCRGTDPKDQKEAIIMRRKIPAHIAK
ncbi:MAG: hypothetical protein WCL14_00035 [Bacteroidota bacterium]